jgi:response regulator RpfG family c-di-GMP phosphodiesterase
VLRKDTEGRAVRRKGDEIPIWGRIVAIADVYDALMSRRVYKEAWDEDAVLNELRTLSGTKFDPELIDAFFEVYPRIREIRERYMDAEA